ncbi:MAG TPA: 16S rRNA (guanine(966)-N(2))-methyltransferase RsmD [Rhodospirillaceae bacterium]|nr:MAG: 16S rRNA (guanine(966)-N(2))-methyltransferase RsmD [Alphaproteobacteria bacterium GWF2_58_20]HAU28521.1 16S rRNA (guanine(966)-N(2))-methyltransferase RsmD [Rhodospirillaceae bacterium]
MRIVAGRHRGRSLCAPSGMDVRPTSDRARQAVFNILENHGWLPEGNLVLGAVVADVFCGTGALGLEALSRGAEKAFFIDSAPQALAACKGNVSLLHEEVRARLFPSTVPQLPAAPEACGLVFLDPPYLSGLIPPALAALEKAGWLAPDAVVVAEVAAREDLDVGQGWERLDRRRYGAAAVFFLRRRQP